MEHEPKPTGGIKLGPKNLRVFFVDHLNIIYCAKAHLLEKLPEIASHVHFTDLREGILETISDVEKQKARVELILTLLDAEVSAAHCPGMVGMVEEAFMGIKQNSGRSHGLRDLSIAYYMQQIESVELASFQVLQMAAVKLKDKQIKKLLNDSYKEARADRTLMLLIAAKYIIAK